MQARATYIYTRLLYRDSQKRATERSGASTAAVHALGKPWNARGFVYMYMLYICTYTYSYRPIALNGKSENENDSSARERGIIEPPPRHFPPPRSRGMERVNPSASELFRPAVGAELRSLRAGLLSRSAFPRVLNFGMQMRRGSPSDGPRSFFFSFIHRSASA